MKEVSGKLLSCPWINNKSFSMPVWFLFWPLWNVDWFWSFSDSALKHLFYQLSVFYMEHSESPIPVLPQGVVCWVGFFFCNCICVLKVAMLYFSTDRNSLMKDSIEGLSSAVNCIIIPRLLQEDWWGLFRGCCVF